MGGRCRSPGTNSSSSRNRTLTQGGVAEAAEVECCKAVGRHRRHHHRRLCLVRGPATNKPKLPSTALDARVSISSVPKRRDEKDDHLWMTITITRSAKQSISKAKTGELKWTEEKQSRTLTSLLELLVVEDQNLLPHLKSQCRSWRRGALLKLPRLKKTGPNCRSGGREGRSGYIA
jgi:hypothetical protein